MDVNETYCDNFAVCAYVKPSCCVPETSSVYMSALSHKTGSRGVDTLPNSISRPRINHSHCPPCSKLNLKLYPRHP